MDKIFFDNLFLKLKSPEKVAVNFVGNRYVFLASKENMNDTVSWFKINSNVVETSLKEKGLSWCYIIETAPDNRPCIYMFIGKGLTQEFLEQELKESLERLPKGIKPHFENTSFLSIDIDKYDNSISELEKELKRVASDVLEVDKL